MIKRVSDMDIWTVASIKLATVAFVFVVLKLWNGAMIWVNGTNIWWFIGAFAIFALRAGAGCEFHCGKFAKKTIKKKK